MDTRVLVKAILRSSFRNEPFFCTPRTIDGSGMLVESDRVLAKGDVVHCSMFFPNLNCIRALARVMMISKRRKGAIHYSLEFMNLSPDQELSLQEHSLKAVS